MRLLDLSTYNLRLEAVQPLYADGTPAPLRVIVLGNVDAPEHHDALRHVGFQAHSSTWQIHATSFDLAQCQRMFLQSKPYDSTVRTLPTRVPAPSTGMVATNAVGLDLSAYGAKCRLTASHGGPADGVPHILVNKTTVSLGKALHQLGFTANGLTWKRAVAGFDVSLCQQLLPKVKVIANAPVTIVPIVSPILAPLLGNVGLPTP